MVDRLAEDHTNARTLAEGVAKTDGLRIDLSTVQTNIVIFDVLAISAAQFLAGCEARGVIGLGGDLLPVGGEQGGNKVRFTTFYGITAEDIEYSLQVFAEVLTP